MTPTQPKPKYSPIHLNSLPLRERPSYRLHRLGPRSLSLNELLAVIIGGERQLEIASKLIARYGSLTAIVRADPHELAQVVDGLELARAEAIIAIKDVSRRLALEKVEEKPQITCPGDAAAILIPDLAYAKQECFVILLLDAQKRLLSIEELYKGTLDGSQVRVGEAFREALRRNCAAIIVAHNHPSGDPTPSSEDLSLTRALIAAGKLLDVEVLDHLLIGDHQSWISLHEQGVGGFERE